MGLFVQILFLVVFVAYLLFALFKKDWAIVLLPTFFPTYLIRSSFLGVPFTLVEVIIYACFLGVILPNLYRVINPLKWWDALFSSITDFVNPKRSLLHSYKWLLLAIGLFVFAGLLSLIITKSEIVMINGETIFYGMKTALGILKGWIFAPILMFIMFLVCLDDNEKVVSLVDIYTVSAVFLGLWGVFELLSGIYITPDSRVSGPFENANYLSLYIGPALLYVIIRLAHVMFPLAEMEKHSFWKLPMKRKKMPLEKPETFLLMVALLVLMPVLVATRSYGAMIGIAVALLFYFLLVAREFRKQSGKMGFPWKFVLGLVSICGVFGLVVYQSDTTKWNNVFAFEDRNSSSVRVEVYQISAGLIAENWFTGIGMGQFPVYYQLEAERFLGHQPYEWNMLHPHNIWVATWLNMGLLGLIAFIWMIVLAVRRTWSSFDKFAYKEIENGSKIKVIGLIMLVEILVHGMLDTPFYKNDLALVFWVVMALIFASDNERVVED